MANFVSVHTILSFFVGNVLRGVPRITDGFFIGTSQNATEGIPSLLEPFMRIFHAFPFGLTVLFMGLAVVSPVWSQGSLLEPEPDAQPSDAKAKAEAFAEQADTFYGSDPIKAAELYTKAIELVPNKIEYYRYRAEAFRNAEEYKKSLDDTYTMNKLWPQDSYAYYLRAEIFMDNLKQYEEAIKDFSKAFELGSLTEALVWRIYCKRMSGDYKGAIEDAQEALKDKKLLANRKDMFLRVYAELVQIYAACPDSKYRDGKLALQYVQKIRESIFDDDIAYGECLVLLGMAYAENGEFEKALEANREARKYFKEEYGQDFIQDYIKEIDLREELYKQNKPFRLPPPPKKDEKQETP